MAILGLEYLWRCMQCGSECPLEPAGNAGRWQSSSWGDHGFPYHRVALVMVWMIPGTSRTVAIKLAVMVSGRRGRWR